MESAPTLTRKYLISKSLDYSVELLLENYCSRVNPSFTSMNTNQEECYSGQWLILKSESNFKI